MANRFQNQQGLSLIEVLIVLAIIAGAVVLGTSSITSSKYDVKKSVYLFALSAKTIQNKAKLYNTTYRLVIDLGNEDRPEQNYWVERSAKSGLVFEGESPVAQRMQALRQGGSEEDLKNLPKSPFIVDKDVLKNDNSLHSSIRFKEVESIKSKDVTMDGLAYIYFLPQGLIDQVAIHLEAGFDGASKEWTVTFNPLTAAPKVVGKYMSLKEMYDQ